MWANARGNWLSELGLGVARLAGDPPDGAMGKYGMSMRTTMKTRADREKPCACSCNVNRSSSCAGVVHERTWAGDDIGLDEQNTQADATTGSEAGGRDGGGRASRPTRP